MLTHSHVRAVAPHPKLIAMLVTSLLVLLLFTLAIDQLLHPQKFRITAIEVTGEFRHVGAKHIKQVVETTLRGNYFSLNLVQIEHALTALPWVHTVALRRRWPDTLIVDTIEVQPIARWGDTHWLHVNGDLVPRAALAEPTAPAILATLATLPQLAGPTHEVAPVWRAFRTWSADFAVHGLGLQQLTLTANGLWYLQVAAQTLPENSPETSTASSPVTIIVEKSHAPARVQRFIATLTQHLMARFAQIQVVDLRYPNGFAIRWRALSALPALPALPALSALSAVWGKRVRRSYA